MNALKQKCLVLSASTYQIQDERTGATNSGLTVFYLPTDNLAPVEDEQARSRGQMSKGLQPAKVSLPYDKHLKVLEVPAMYELSLQMVTRQLKTQIQPVDIDFIGTLETKLTQAKQ